MQGRDARGGLNKIEVMISVNGKVRQYPLETFRNNFSTIKL